MYVFDLGVVVELRRWIASTKVRKGSSPGRDLERASKGGKRPSIEPL